MDGDTGEPVVPQAEPEALGKEQLVSPSTSSRHSQARDSRAELGLKEWKLQVPT